MGNLKSLFCISRKSLQGGFTLLELLMVVIIIAILASLAVPQYLKTIEKSRMTEAIGILGQMRASEIRYRAENGTFTPTMSQLDFDPTADLAGTPVFTYSISAAAAATFTARATRNAAPPVGGNCIVGYKIEINQAATWVGRDCQS